MSKGVADCDYSSSLVYVSRLSTNVDSAELLTCFNELGSLWWEALKIESSALISVTDTDLNGTSFRDSMSDPPSSLLALEEPDGELTTCKTVTWSNEIYGFKISCHFKTLHTM